MNFEMLHPADQIVMIMNRIYSYGMTTTPAATCPSWMRRG